MAPDIPDGSIVVIRVQDYASPKNTIVAWTPEEGMLCKFLETRTEDGFYVLTSFNPVYRPIYTKRLNIYGIVWEVRRRMQIINENHN